MLWRSFCEVGSCSALHLIDGKLCFWSELINQCWKLVHPQPQRRKISGRVASTDHWRRWSNERRRRFVACVAAMDGFMGSFGGIRDGVPCFDHHKALCSIPRAKVTDLRHVCTPVYNFDPLDLGGRTSSLQSISSYASGVEVDTDVDHAPSTQFLSGGDLYNDQPSKHGSNLNVGSSHSMSDLQIDSCGSQQISYGGGGSTIIGLNPSSSSAWQTSSSSLEHIDPTCMSALSTLIQSQDVILPLHTGKSPHAQESPTGVSLTTQEGASASESTKMTGKSNGIEQSKKLAPTKMIQKKARPGQGGRPRPKDRQQIQDRIMELRHLVPSGKQSSIDRLLGRTFQYALFLQGMIKYANRLPSIDEPWIIEGENGFVLKDSGGGGNGCTWAFEIGGQSMICPLMVENLNPTGQTLVEANKGVTGTDIFLSVVQLLQHISGSNSNSRNAVIEESSRVGPLPSI